MAKGSPLTLLAENKTISRHGEEHRAILRAHKTDIFTKEPFPQGKALSAYAHSGRLNDHVPDVSKLQDSLSAEQKKFPDVKK